MAWPSIVEILKRRPKTDGANPKAAKKARQTKTKVTKKGGK